MKFFDREYEIQKLWGSHSRPEYFRFLESNIEDMIAEDELSDSFKIRGSSNTYFLKTVFFLQIAKTEEMTGLSGMREDN